MKYIIAISTLLSLGGVFLYLHESQEELNVLEQQKVQQHESQRESAVKTEIDYEIESTDFVDARTLLADVSTGAVSADDADGLRFMREEEKLARDVYVFLYDKWGIQIFKNISESEQTHMDAVLTLLERYELGDSATTDMGVFNNQDLQSLYNQLTTQGSQSVTDALTVGALIEDLDIADLQNYIDATDSADITLVYESLQRGSRNHLRAFNRQLVAHTGTPYTPQYISEEQFLEIVGSGTETGPMNGGGAGKSSGGPRGGNRN